MDIRPDDVKEIKTVGTLHGEDVKLVVTHGGLHILCGIRNKNDKKPEILTASSHRGIGIHNVEKQFGKNFQSSLAKSESCESLTIEDLTDFLPPSLIKSGYSLSLIQNQDQSFDVLTCKFGLQVLSINSDIIDGEIKINKTEETEFFEIDNKKDLYKTSIEALVKKKLGV